MKRINLIIFLLSLFILITMIYGEVTPLASERKNSNATGKKIPTIESGINIINKIDITINPNGFATVVENLIVNETRVSLFISKSVDDLIITDSGGNKLGYELKAKDESQLLTFYLKSPQKKDITLSYLTPSLTKKDGRTWSLTFSTPASPRTTIIKTKFPEGANVSSLKSEQTMYIYPPKLESPIFIYPQSNEILFKAKYTLQSEMNVTSEFDNNPIFYTIILIVALFFLTVFLHTMFFGKKGRKQREEKIEKVKEPNEEEREELKIKDHVINMLDENEKRVIRMLEKSPEDEITQAYIYKTLNIPKASLSEIIKRLEQRNLIEKKKEGRTNWIKIKNWVFN